MNHLTRYLLALTVSFMASNPASASIIYSFDVSDVSWAQSVEGDWTDMSLWFEFEDSADLNALTGTEILSMGFDNGSDSGLFDTSLGGVNIGALFGISSGVASLTVGDTGSSPGVLYCFSNACPGRMQVGQSPYTSMRLLSPQGTLRRANAFNNGMSRTYYSDRAVNIPVYSTAALLALGLALCRLARRPRPTDA